MNNLFSKLHLRHILIIAAVIAVVIAGVSAAFLLHKQPAPQSKNAANETTAIVNARIFDGERIIDDHVVVIKGAVIHAIGGTIPEDAAVIDAKGATLLPGFIDSHVHTDMDGLRDALVFGVTTELEMMGTWSAKKRMEIAGRDDIADLRSPGMAITTKGGHPSQYIKTSDNLVIRYFFRFPYVTSPDDAVKFVDTRIAEGADYIKIIIEDGTIVGIPGLPVISDKTLLAAIHEAHDNNRMAIAHVSTAAGAALAIDSGIDGLAHLFYDCAPPPELVAAIASSGAFVVPNLVTASTAFGNNAAALAADERVRSRLSKKWLDSLCGSMNTYPDGKMEDVFTSVLELHRAGVDILAGSDVSEPIPGLGGLAHGASLHHELQMLVAAGLKPIEALRAATATPARRFGLTDRGRIAPGMLADLLLVEGDPLTTISDTLSIRTVWHRGTQLIANR
ncbi:MAG: amidohydrolase family protein [Treponema sp.]|jgi:imidazolonepropionase-like amidohydrolase|nr:amidohydrolase family protein [Treponema sp.]